MLHYVLCSASRFLHPMAAPLSGHSRLSRPTRGRFFEKKLKYLSNVISFNICFSKEPNNFYNVLDSFLKNTLEPFYKTGPMSGNLAKRK